MGRIVVTEFVSLDGVMEAPGGGETCTHGGWTFKINRGPEGDKFNTMPKYVVSSTLTRPAWNNSTVLAGNAAEQAAKLKQELRGDIAVHGSARLVQTLLEHDLVDELRLMVFPVLLGRGKRLFGETADKKSLRLVESRVFGDGIVLLTLRPEAKGQSS